VLAQAKPGGEAQFDQQLRCSAIAGSILKGFLSLFERAPGFEKRQAFDDTLVALFFKSPDKTFYRPIVIILRDEDGMSFTAPSFGLSHAASSPFRS
jgi:hypothetical protein